MTTKIDTEYATYHLAWLPDFGRQDTKCDVYPQSGTDPGSKTYVRSIATRNSTPVPFWRSRISRGVNATGPWSASFQNTDIQDGAATARWNRRCTYDSRVIVHEWDRKEGLLVPAITTSGIPTGSLMSPVRNSAAGKFYQQALIANTRLGVALGEFRQTADMLRHPLGAQRDLFYSYLGSVKKYRTRFYKRLNTSRATLSWLRNAYLEFTFGWNPLVNDVKGIVKSLQQGFDEFVPIRSYASDKQQAGPIGHGTWISANYFRGYYNDIKTLEASVRCLGMYRHKGWSDYSAFGNLQQLLGLNINNFVPTMWDLLPYSFVFDYFVNVSDLLAASCSARSNVAWSNTSTREEKVYERRPYLDRKSVV